MHLPVLYNLATFPEQYSLIFKMSQLITSSMYVTRFVSCPTKLKTNDRHLKSLVNWGGGSDTWQVEGILRQKLEVRGG